MSPLLLAGLAVLPLAANGFAEPEAQPVALIAAIDAAGWRLVVATIPQEAAPRIGPVRFGVGTSRRFWYVAADGAKHEVAVPEPGAPTR